MMEDFGHGIVDSRQVVLLVIVTVARAADRDRVARAPARPAARRCAARAPAARLATPISDRRDRGDDAVPRRGGTTRAATGRGHRCTTCRRGRWRAARAAAAGRGDDLPLRRSGFGEGARRRRADARDHRLSARAGRAHHRARGRTSSRAVEIDPDRDPQRAEAAMQALRHRPLRDAAGGGRVHVGDALEGRDLGGSGRARAGRRRRAGPGAARLAGRGGVPVGAADRHQRRSAARSASRRATASPTSNRLEDGGYATFADELRRDGDAVRALARVGDAAAIGCRVLVVAEPAQALSASELGALRSFVDGGGRLLVMLGPVFARDGGRVRARRSGGAGGGVRRTPSATTWSSIPRAPATSRGRRCGRPGPTSYRPHPLTARFGGRLTYWPRTREVAPLDRPVPGLAVATARADQPGGVGRDRSRHHPRRGGPGLRRRARSQGPGQRRGRRRALGATSDAAGFSGHAGGW